MCEQRIEDLKRLDNDEVRNSEYIEEDVILRYSFEQRSQLFTNSNVILNSQGQEDILFKFQANGGTGGAGEKFKNSHLNRSNDPLDESHRLSTGGGANGDYKREQITH